jgi:hypothetical protein
MNAEVVEFLAHGSGPLVNEFTVPGGGSGNAGRELRVTVNWPRTSGTVLQAEGGDVESGNSACVSYTSAILTGDDKELCRSHN